jgi:hypothetical protein
VIPVTLPRSTGHRTTPYFQCVTCHGLFRIRNTRNKRSCVECEHLREKAKVAAGQAIKREIKAGRMFPASNYKCRDCGKQAVCYDHRSYAKPLEAEPVCKSCNGLRGPAAL